MQFYLEVISSFNPSIYTIDHSMFIVSNSKEESILKIFEAIRIYVYLEHAQIKRVGGDIKLVPPMENVGPPLKPWKIIVFLEINQTVK